MATRWGIASVGQISHDFTTALSTLPDKEHKVVAVAARDLPRAQAFAKLHGVDKAYGSYKELAQDPNVEVVYIGALNPQHLEIAKLMFQHGKHVLCEKPLTLNKKQTTELLKEAEKKGLFAMEAIWSRCFPVYDAVKKEIKSGAIGEIKHVIASFGFNLEQVERLTTKELGGGTILDLGVYTIQFASFVFDGEKPTSITAAGHLNEEGVDMSMSATLLYKNGRMATIMTNAMATLPNEGIIVGTKGIIRVPQFWCPTRVELPSGTFEAPLPEAKLKFNYVNSAGLRYEAAEVRACLKANKRESEIVKHSDSLLIAEIEDELRRQIGVVYEADKN